MEGGAAAQAVVRSNSQSKIMGRIEEKRTLRTALKVVG